MFSISSDWKIQKQAEESLYDLLARTIDAQPRQWKQSGKDISRGRGDGCGALARVSKSEAKHIERSIRDAAREVAKIQKEVKAPIDQIIQAAAQAPFIGDEPWKIAESIRDSIYTLRHDAFISDMYRHEKRWTWDEVHAESCRVADESLQRELNRMSDVIYGRHRDSDPGFLSDPDTASYMQRLEEAHAVEDHQPWWKIW